MKTTIEIKSIFGKVLFTYTNENATIKDAVEQAIKEKVSLNHADLRSANLCSANLYLADLSSADLRSANLSSADLCSANLSSADLSSANLSSADLSSADLSSANLRSADLCSANLSSANLSSADLSSAKNKEKSHLPIFCKWTHSIKGDLIQIGCKEKTIEEWDSFFKSEEVYSTERDTDDFKQIQAVYESYKAYLNFLNKC
ncbi:pentapeptide repeat-containing protein [Flavobacterium sp.]|uniref:pentapeptide repeat-containing protein n=1 Tax=Flavobacterium sp. TaxID=239 RepID=UPI0025E90230|nr:pentapeptide repeat-containing protein [Flavobacterium sp.]